MTILNDFIKECKPVLERVQKFIAIRRKEIENQLRKRFLFSKTTSA